MIVVASVHHTGTNFVWQHLLAGVPEVGMDYGRYSTYQPPKNGFVRIHCDRAQHEYLQWWLNRCVCIVPLRHPISVAESWKARGKDLSELAGQWQILKNEVDPHDPMYLPVDSPERMNWLDTISRHVNQELQTGWPVVMSCHKSAQLTDDERASVLETMADGFFNRFYKADTL